MADIDFFTMRKQPAERRTYTVDFSNKVPSAVTIASAAVAVVDPDTLESHNSMLASTTGTVSGDTVSFVVLGGEDGREYKITVTATLSSADILTADILLSVREF